MTRPTNTHKDSRKQIVINKLEAALMRISQASMPRDKEAQTLALLEARICITDAIATVEKMRADS